MTTPAPEPVEVAADELAAALSDLFDLLADVPEELRDE